MCLSENILVNILNVCIIYKCISTTYVNELRNE